MIRKKVILLVRKLINVCFDFNEETCTPECLRSWISPRVIMLFHTKEYLCVSLLQLYD